MQPQKQNSKSRSPRKNTDLDFKPNMTDEEYIKQLLSPRIDAHSQSLPTSPLKIEDDQEAIDPIAAQEREELKKTCNDNNEIIRQILKDTA